MSLQHWTCLFEAGLCPSFILNKKLCLFLDLEAGALDLSLQHWTCLLEARRRTCHFSIGLIFLEAAPKKLCVSGLVNWSVGLVNPAPTCHLSIGLVFWKLGHRPSFILNTKLFLFLDLDTQTLDLSLQHWSCLLEAGLSTQLHSCKTCTCPQERELVEASLDFHQSFRLSTNSAKITSLEPSLCICFDFLFDHFVFSKTLNAVSCQQTPTN